MLRRRVPTRPRGGRGAVAVAVGTVAVSTALAGYSGPVGLSSPGVAIGMIGMIAIGLPPAGYALSPARSRLARGALPVVTARW